jgi:hypothetical protein
MLGSVAQASVLVPYHSTRTQRQRPNVRVYSRKRQKLRQGRVCRDLDANGAPHLDASSYSKQFSDKYAHRIINGSIGHNLPQEAPQAFAQAVVQVDRY